MTNQDLLIIEVIVPIPKMFALFYTVSKKVDIKMGSLVIVPFMSKTVLGIVTNPEIEQIDRVMRLKNIIGIFDEEIIISKSLIKFIYRVSEYYLSEVGTITKLVLPIIMGSQTSKILTQNLPEEFSLAGLSKDQSVAYEDIIQNSDRPIIIKGVTGSGKTELYFHLIAKNLKEGSQILLLLPEIALTEQIVARFAERFGFRPAVWNSNVTLAKKKALFNGIILGKVKIVIGARSSLFLPYKNLKLIIVDEEHDSSYKQDEGLTYHARDMAILRAHMTNAQIVLGSATPSIETLYNASIGKYHLINLVSRYAEASLPKVNIIDMRKQKMDKSSWISPSLLEACKKTIARGEQILLFLNRRGYAPLLLCKACGHQYQCKNCSSSLVLHDNIKKMECHYCGYFCQVPSKCICKAEDSLVACGPGVERIAKQIREYFPELIVEVISKDSFSSIKQVRELLGKIEQNEINILVGTQIITKGYHFPNLTLVGVIDADIGLVSGSLRASEKAFQLLHQVGGRAGRETKKGEVYLQTYYPDHLVIHSIIKNDFMELFDYELLTRKEAFMPPFSKIAAIMIASKQDKMAELHARIFLRAAPKTESGDLKIYGPAPAVVFKHSGKFRYHIIVVCDKKFNLQQFLKYWLSLVKLPSACQIKIDIDPQNFF